MTEQLDPYISTNQLMARLRVCRRTLNRYAVRGNGQNPLPTPARPGRPGVQKLWLLKDIEAWEQQEFSRHAA